MVLDVEATVAGKVIEVSDVQLVNILSKLLQAVILVGKVTESKLVQFVKHELRVVHEFRAAGKITLVKLTQPLKQEFIAVNVVILVGKVILVNNLQLWKAPCMSVKEFCIPGDQLIVFKLKQPLKVANILVIIYDEGIVIVPNAGQLLKVPPKLIPELETEAGNITLVRSLQFTNVDNIEFNLDAAD